MSDAEFEPITSQEDFERRLSDRLQRERAKFADYDDLKQKAAKYAEHEESQKTEIQKANEAREAAERALATKEAEALRLTVAAKHGITGDNLDLLTGADEAELEARAERIKSLTTPKETKGLPGPYVPPEGTGSTGAVGTSTADLFAAAIEQQLS